MTHETLLSSGRSFSSLPDSYVRPPSERPRLSEVLPFRSIPVIDLASPDRSDVLRQVRHACASYGFFQVLHPLLSYLSRPLPSFDLYLK